MRIAIVAEVFLPKIDGVVLRTANLIRQLRAMGDDVLVFCPEGEGPGDPSIPAVRFESYPCPNYPEYRIGIVDDRLISNLDSFRPDVVHFVNPFVFAFRCFDKIVAAGRRFPSVFSFHTLYGEFVKSYAFMSPLSGVLWWLTREYHNSAHLNLTVSDAMVEELRGRGFERVQLWQPAVDSQLFNPDKNSADIRRRLSAGHPEASLLVTASRLAPEKNIEFLANVIKAFPNARLAIVGDGPHRAALERKFHGLPVHFTGYLKGAALASAYASADLFVYASETETMGNVVLEAMAAGLPVIAPRAGGLKSVVQHGKTGFLFTPRETYEAVDSVASLLNDPDLRKRIAHNARSWAAQLTWESAAARVRADYANVARGNLPRPALRSGPASALSWCLALSRFAFRRSNVSPLAQASVEPVRSSAKAS